MSSLEHETRKLIALLQNVHISPRTEVDLQSTKILSILPKNSSKFSTFQDFTVCAVDGSMSTENRVNSPAGKITQRLIKMAF